MSVFSINKDKMYRLYSLLNSNMLRNKGMKSATAKMCCRFCKKRTGNDGLGSLNLLGKNKSQMSLNFSNGYLSPILSFTLLKDKINTKQCKSSIGFRFCGRSREQVFTSTLPH